MSSDAKVQLTFHIFDDSVNPKETRMEVEIFRGGGEEKLEIQCISLTLSPTQDDK